VLANSEGRLMFGFLVRRGLALAAKRSNVDLRHMIALQAASPAAFRKFGKLAMLSRHRELVPVDAYYAAMLVGNVAEDCGPCTQLVVNMASKAGVDDAQIEAVLRRDPDALAPDAALGFRFAHAIVFRTADQEEARQAVRDQWGDKGIIDLTFACQINRLYPMIKAGLGFASECRQVTLGSRTIAVAKQAA
jgi:hypothetical protein